MKIETLTFVYNEQFLLPFYLKHYDFCDKFNIIYDTDSNDKTLEILKSNPKVNILPFTFPDGMDDLLKVSHLPTTRDMDELYREIYLLKKRVETLEKELKGRHDRAR